LGSTGIGTRQCINKSTYIIDILFIQSIHMIDESSTDNGVMDKFRIYQNYWSKDIGTYKLYLVRGYIIFYI